MARRGLHDKRLALLLAAFAVGLVIVAARLVFIQTVQAEKFGRLARKQRLRTINLAPQRGVILDRDGVPLAMSEDVLTITANPYFITGPGRVAARLSPLLHVGRGTLQRRLSRRGGFSYVTRKVPLATARRIQAMQIPGLDFEPDSLRRYPGGRLAAQVLGFVGMDGKGLAGLELYYEKILGGRPGILIAEQDPAHRPIPGSVIRRVEPVDGQSIRLTLDSHIQYKAELELQVAVSQFGARGGTVIVMNPTNGELFAVANLPTFDPNGFARAEKDNLRNRAMTDAYEPGSTMKMVTASAALEENIADPHSSFFLPSTITVSDRTIHEAHPREARDFTFTEIVTQSSNVGAVTLGLKLGKERLYRHIAAFGLTDKTGVDFPGESDGVMPTPRAWSSSTIGNVPFGQGIAATPIQMAQALAVIANGGVRTHPHFLLGTNVADAPGSKHPRRRVISPRVAKQMQVILEQVVQSGTGENAKIHGYEVAGKTGTAQKPPYGSGKYLASFMGFAPSKNPQLAVLVAIDEPTNAIYGSVVAAPAFAKITEFALKHLRIPPRP